MCLRLARIETFSYILTGSLLFLVLHLSTDGLVLSDLQLSDLPLFLLFLHSIYV